MPAPEAPVSMSRRLVSFALLAAVVLALASP
ncbi:MAG: hypothetical protein RL760_494, partial [Candidatus Eisenbacteria bacterium]